MRSLQYRIAFILVGSLLAVMLVATAATMWILASAESMRTIEPTARRIALAKEMFEWQQAGGASQTLPDGSSAPPGVTFVPADASLPDPPFGLAAGSTSSDGILFPDRPPLPSERVGEAPASGTPRDDFTAALKALLAEQGMTGEVMVTEIETGQVIASYKLAEGKWALIGFPRPIPPPPGLWIAVTGWIAVVIVGVLAVVLVMARRVTEPFVILERAVASVGPDGGFPRIPEKGTGEARHTAAVLNGLSDRLRETMESRMRLVAAAGHDLRTPMTRMRLRAEFLPDEDRQRWIDDLDELELIADSAIGLVREEGAGEDQINVALDALVRQTVDELVAAGLPVRLEAAEPAVARAAPLSLRRALRNLFTNAATHGGGAVVRLAADNGQARVIIDDSGPGIPPELMGRMFEPFFRVNPARGKQIKGAGLGLAIAKDIVERFGGSIDISNRPEGGLHQVVTLQQLGGGATA